MCASMCMKEELESPCPPFASKMQCEKRGCGSISKQSDLGYYVCFWSAVQECQNEHRLEKERQSCAKHIFSYSESRTLARSISLLNPFVSRKTVREYALCLRVRVHILSGASVPLGVMLCKWNAAIRKQSKRTTDMSRFRTTNRLSICNGSEQRVLSLKTAQGLLYHQAGLYNLALRFVFHSPFSDTPPSAAVFSSFLTLVICLALGRSGWHCFPRSGSGSATIKGYFAPPK